jgi:PiT family inorganic phosphate transporter
LWELVQTMWKILGGVFLGWSLGANHSANIFGTGVATGVIRYRTAIILTAAFVCLGAILEGSKTITTVAELAPLKLTPAFICSLAAGMTMAVLTFLAIPASTSQALVGAVLGAGLVSGSADLMKFYAIAFCWLLTPFCGMFLAYLLYHVLGYLLEKTVKTITYRNLFYALGILASGCYGAYCLGGNGVGNVTGVYVGAGLISPLWASVIGGLSIASGVLSYSRKVMKTVGKEIVALDPFSACIAVFSESATLHLFTQLGVPVSSSQAIVGAVLGVGLIRDFRTVSLRMLAAIGIGWFLTPVSAGFFSYFAIRCLV